MSLEKKRKTYSEEKSLQSELVDKLRDANIDWKVLKFIERVIDLNALPVGMCTFCDEPDFEGKFTSLVTNKWGQEDRVCSDCVRYCRGCKMEYAVNMEHYHSDCVNYCQYCDIKYGERHDDDREDCPRNKGPNKTDDDYTAIKFISCV